MITRRTFCIGVTSAAFLWAAAGCRQRVAVLKIPENGDECVDFFKFFTDPAFELEEARTGLKVTGEPHIYEMSGFKRFSYENQAGPASDIILEMSDRLAEGQALRLSTIDIRYKQPIDVSLKSVELAIGVSKEFNNILLGRLGRPKMKIVSNTARPVRHGPPQRSLYLLSPEGPLSAGALKGQLRMESNPTENNVKKVISLSYDRIP